MPKDEESTVSHKDNKGILKRNKQEAGGKRPTRGQQVLKLHCSLKEQLTEPEF